MRVIIRPSTAPHLHIDVTKPLVAAIAHELSRVQEGSEMLNWLEAERILDTLVNHAPTRAGPVAPTVEIPEDERPQTRGSTWRHAASSLRGADGAGGPVSATRS
ncbi:MAG: hypothetical protein IT437_01790 [Phycisphaerales bacterium]|nr:hypothetical protein [Phycisphaerales bacterium]